MVARLNQAEDRPLRKAKDWGQPCPNSACTRLLGLDCELGRAPVSPEAGWQIVAVPAPDDFPRGPARVRLLMGDVWRPPADASHTDDTRALGVRVRRIWREAAG